MVLRPAALASLGHMLEMHIPRRTASDPLGVGPRHVCCDSPPLGTGIQALVAGSG